MLITRAEIEFDRLVRDGHLRAVRELNETPVEMLDPGNPNHPVNSGLFGQETGKFLRKQYK